MWNKKKLKAQEEEEKERVNNTEEVGILQKKTIKTV